MWSLFLGVVIVAKISLGAIYDRYGLRAGTLLGTAACIIAAIPAASRLVDKRVAAGAPMLDAEGFEIVEAPSEPPVSQQ